MNEVLFVFFIDLIAYYAGPIFINAGKIILVYDSHDLILFAFHEFIVLFICAFHVMKLLIDKKTLRFIIFKQFIVRTIIKSGADISIL